MPLLPRIRSGEAATQNDTSCLLGRCSGFPSLHTVSQPATEMQTSATLAALVWVETVRHSKDKEETRKVSLVVSQSRF